RQHHIVRKPGLAGDLRASIYPSPRDADDVHRHSELATTGDAVDTEKKVRTLRGGEASAGGDRRFDGREDLPISGAAAETAGERLADLIARRVRVFIQQRLGGDQESWRAVTALG